MNKTTRSRSQLPVNLPQLQNLIKRDSESYKEEFQMQYRHYQALLQLFLLNPSQESKSLEELVMFLSQVVQCYAEEMQSFPCELQSLLKQHASVLHPDVRMTLCRSLILMRNKDFIPCDSLLELFFSLFRCPDKLLRATLYTHIISDIKRINSKHKNNKVNKVLQNFMYSMLKDSNKIAAKMSLDAMIELYHKNVWRDAKTVNVMATACFSPYGKVMVAAVKYFLTDGDEEVEKRESSDSESDNESVALRKMIIAKQTSKSGRKREKKAAKALQMLKKNRKKSHSHCHFSALHLLHDPQDFAEKLFKRLERSKEHFEVRLLLMHLISRLIGVHQLFLFNFYPFLQRYLQPHQKEVTRVLTFLAQASHELVPPEVIEPVLRAVVDNFITERNSSEAIAVGLNAVRELCARCPLAMSADLLQDLAGYKSYKNKSVMMSARSLIQLFRTINPSLLSRKDKGKPMEGGTTTTVRDYGQLHTVEHVPGSELLNLPLEENRCEEADYTDLEQINISQLHSENGEELEVADSHGDFVMDSLDSGRKWETTSCSSDGEDKDEWEKGMEGVEEEEGEKEQQPLLTSKEMSSTMVQRELMKVRKEQAAIIGRSRFLTQEEFRDIRLQQIATQLEPSSGKKRQIQELTREAEDVLPQNLQGELVPLSQIESLAKRKKMDKEARLASIKIGREGRENYGFKKRRLNPCSSTTNQEKRKKKAFMMVRHNRGIRHKKKRSFREKQIALRDSLLKSKRRK